MSEIQSIADVIGSVLSDIGNTGVRNRAKEEVARITSQFDVPGL